jgi:hypothetical protein
VLLHACARFLLVAVGDCVTDTSMVSEVRRGRRDVVMLVEVHDRRGQSQQRTVVRRPHYINVKARIFRGTQTPLDAHSKLLDIAYQSLNVVFCGSASGKHRSLGLNCKPDFEELQCDPLIENSVKTASI